MGVNCMNELKTDRIDVERHWLPLCGAAVPPERVVGRQEIIADIVRFLDAGQSVLLTAERRIGKTAVLNKLAAEPPKGWRIVYRQVEGVSSPAELVNDLQRALEEELGLGPTIFSRLRRLYTDIGISGLQLGPITLPVVQQSWKLALQSLLEDAGSVKGYHVLVIWDEFPNAIWKIAEKDCSMAADVLDVLRAYRQSSPRGVRFVFAGSIGFHLVLSRLREAGAHRARPMNDLSTIPVGALAPEDAFAMARDGLIHFADRDSVSFADPVEDVAHDVAAGADNLPFYIDHLLMRLRDTAEPLTREHVKLARERLLANDTGSNDFRHYRNRIRDYYPQRERNLCLEVLDRIASHPSGLTRDELLVQVAPAGEVTRHDLKAAIELLVDDHYVHATGSSAERRFAFKYEIVRDWWRQE